MILTRVIWSFFLIGSFLLLILALNVYLTYDRLTITDFNIFQDGNTNYLIYHELKEYYLIDTARLYSDFIPEEDSAIVYVDSTRETALFDEYLLTGSFILLLTFGFSTCVLILSIKNPKLYDQFNESF